MLNVVRSVAYDGFCIVEYNWMGYMGIYVEIQWKIFLLDKDVGCNFLKYNIGDTLRDRAKRADQTYAKRIHIMIATRKRERTT